MSASSPVEKVRYEELLPGEFLERLHRAPIAYLPLGTLEWHGPHLPLGADGLQSRSFFEGLARQVGGIVLPMLFLGPDGMSVKDGVELHGMDRCGDNFQGSMRYPDQQLPGSAYRVEDAVFDEILANVLRLLARAGFRIVVAHGHGPSILRFREKAPAWSRRHHLILRDAWGDFSDPDEIAWGLMVDHAGSNETSILQVLHPELVDLSRLPTDPEVWPLAVGMEDPRRSASPERGRLTIDRQTRRMAALLREDLASLSPVASETL
jgi:creatinine amidohydrolase